MSDYFGRLAARTLDPACLLQPRITPRFAWQDDAAEAVSGIPQTAAAKTTPRVVEQPKSAPANQTLPGTTILRTASETLREVATTVLSQTSSIAPAPQAHASARETRVERVTSRDLSSATVSPERPPDAARVDAHAAPIHEPALPGERVRTIETSAPAQRQVDEIPAQHIEPPAVQTNVVITPARIERIERSLERVKSVERIERVERVENGVPHEVTSPEPDVHITIGRIDVRSVTAAAAVRAVAPPRSPRPKTLTLEEYLAQRSEAQR